MRTTLITASLAFMLAASPVFADPLGEILSLARSIAYEVDDFEYGDDDFYDERPMAPYYYAGRPSGGWRYVNGGAVPPADELVHMDYRTLRAMVRAAAADFDRWLVGIPAGGVWRKHFDTPALLELAASDVDAPPTAEERESIAHLLAIFDEAVATPDLDQLTRTDSARTLHVALRELHTPPDQRLLRQLSLSARALNRTLGTISTGATWQRYLALPDAILAAADRPLGEAASRQDFDAAKLDEVLKRYEHVTQIEAYSAIAALPEFQMTYERLKAFVNPPPEEPNPPPEELPPPELPLE